MNNSPNQSRRVALVANASFYIGPPTARLLAQRGHDLVLGDPADGLVEELEAVGATVASVDGVWDLAEPDSSERLVATALDRFGHIDAAVEFSGNVVMGRFMESSFEDLKEVERGNIEAPYHFLKAVLAPMIERGDGQVLILTSATGASVTPGAPLYSATRAGANHLVRNVADEVARHGVQVNAIGTNYLDFPEFLRATGATDPAVRAMIEDLVPMKRLGSIDECAALCVAFLDGTSRFATGQFISLAGGSN